MSDDDDGTVIPLHRGRGVERLSVNVSALTAERVRRIAKKRDDNVTETIRRAVAVLAMLEDEVWSAEDVNPRPG